MYCYEQFIKSLIFTSNAAKLFDMQHFTVLFMNDHSSVNLDRSQVGQHPLTSSLTSS